MQVLFEIMVQIKQKGGIGVENPSPRSFSGRISDRTDMNMRNGYESPHIRYSYPLHIFISRCGYESRCMYSVSHEISHRDESCHTKMSHVRNYLSLLSHMTHLCVASIYIYVIHKSHEPITLCGHGS